MYRGGSSGICHKARSVKARSASPLLRLFIGASSRPAGAVAAGRNGSTHGCIYQQRPVRRSVRYTMNGGSGMMPRPAASECNGSAVSQHYPVTVPVLPVGPVTALVST